MYPNTTAAITSYDPSTGATGRANLDATHGYSESQLASRETFANETLAIEGVTDAERAAAEKVLSIITTLRNSAGSFNPGSSTSSFKAPHNYGSSKIYYQITVKNSSGDLIFGVVVTVQTENDPLPAAYKALQDARVQGDEIRSHVHDYTAGNWQYDGTEHWRTLECSCGDTKEEREAHTFTDVTNTTETGFTVTHTCTVCGYSYDEVHEHHYDPASENWEHDENEHWRMLGCSCGDTKEERAAHTFVDEVTDPTTGSQGYTTHTCSVCGYSFKDNYTDPLPEEP